MQLGRQAQRGIDHIWNKHCLVEDWTFSSSSFLRYLDNLGSHILSRLYLYHDLNAELPVSSYIVVSGPFEQSETNSEEQSLSCFMPRFLARLACLAIFAPKEGIRVRASGIRQSVITSSPRAYHPEIPYLLPYPCPLAFPSIYYLPVSTLYR